MDIISEIPQERTQPTAVAFGEKLWHATVDRVTVYNDDRLIYSLKDGGEITVMYALRENRKIPRTAPRVDAVRGCIMLSEKLISSYSEKDSPRSASKRATISLHLEGRSKKIVGKM